MLKDFLEWFTMQENYLIVTPKFCAKIAGVKTIQIAPNLAYFLRFEVLDTEGCQHDKATRPLSNAP